MADGVLGRLDDINKNCLEEFRKHWQCLDSNNQQLWHCRRPEQLLSRCIFDKLVRVFTGRSYKIYAC